MTVTLAYGNPADGNLWSSDVNYETARTGPADSALTSDPTAYYGQADFGPDYSIYLGFVHFSYPAIPAGDLVVSATVRLTQATQNTPGVVRDLECRHAPWVPTLTTADWRTPVQLSAAPLFAVVRGVQASLGKDTYAGSEALRAHVPTVTGVELSLASSRQRLGNVPAGDESSAIRSADASGTSQDPLLIISTVPRHALLPHLGAEAQLSDGSAVYLQPTGVGTIALRHSTLAGVVSDVATLTVGTGSEDWADVAGAQGLSLAVDSLDNIYAVGRAGDSANTLRQRAYVKVAGSWSWTAGTARRTALPAHDAPINNVTVAWHPTAGGSLMIFASHTAGEAVAGSSPNDLVWVLVNSQYLLDGTGSLLRGSGSAVDSGLASGVVKTLDFNGFSNESGTGLDLVADAFSANPGAGGPEDGWGYLATFGRAQGMGDAGWLALARYQLSTTGLVFSHTSHTLEGWARKDAAGKVRVLSTGPGRVALVAADPTPARGVTVTVFQSNGATSGWVALGSVPLAGESIPSMPDGPMVASSQAWDAIYSATENAVWVYYANAAAPSQIMRTSVDLDTHQATRTEVLVYTGAGAIQAVRASRNARVSARTHLSVAVAGGTYAGVLDTLDLPPLAPTLTPRANYDATQAAIFAWTFSDPYAGDTQTAYQLQVVRVSDDGIALDTAKTPGTGSAHSVAGGTLANGQDYRWRVRTWDALDGVGPWSEYGTFTTSATGSVTITLPATDNPPGVVTDEVQVTWTLAGTVQAKRYAWVTRNDTAEVVYDSGWVTSTATTAAVSGMVSGVEHTIRVQVENAAAVRSGIGTRLVTPSYGTPEVPLVTLTPTPEEGYVLVTVENPIPGEPGSGFPFWDFEGAPNFAPWFKSAATLVVDATTSHRGTQSAKLTATGGGATQAYCRAPADPVTPLQRYSLRSWLMSPVTRDLGLVIDWQTSTGTYITSTATTVTVAAGAWVEVLASGTAPANAATATYGWTLRNTPEAGAVAYADDLRMAPASDRPEVVRNRIFRRPVEGIFRHPWEALGECEPDGTFRDYTVPSGTPVEYMARGESI